MLKLVCKCSASSINGFRPLRQLFWASSYSIIPTKQQEEAEHPSSTFPNFLVENLGFSKQQSLSLSTKLAAFWPAQTAVKRVSAFNFSANANSVIDFFKLHGFEDSDIRKFISYDPRILTYKVHETLVPKFKVLQDLGISGSDLVSVVLANPMLITTRVESVLQDLKVFLGTHDILVDFLKKRRFYRAHSSSLANLVSNVRLLESDYGISTHIIRSHIVRHDGAFFRNSELFKQTLMEVEHKWGISPTSGAFLYGVDIFGRFTPELIESKIRLFKSFEWNQSDIMTMIQKNPKVLCSSEARLRRSLEFLMNEMGYEPAFLSCCPAMFTYSLETRLLPRQKILVILRKKGLISTACALHKVAFLPDLKFFHKFLEPYKDAIPDLYRSYLSSRGCQTNQVEPDAA